MTTLLLIAVGVFVAFMVGVQILVRIQARAMRGKPLPPLPGSMGKKLAEASSALVYFMSPSCGACRAWTPKLEKLREKNGNVFVVDVSEQMDIARALRVMATPSAIEVHDGRVAGYHVGAIPSDVLARFARA